jgi:hypothetical protein
MSEAEAHIVFFDIIALVKRYHREVGTREGQIYRCRIWAV